MRHIDRLKEQYPQLLSDYLGGRDIEVGYGWMPIVENMLLELSLLETSPQIVQIKEKFGMLSVYCLKLPWEDKAWNVVEAAELLASKICEGCGSSVDVTTDGKTWITTQCAACRLAGRRIYDFE